MSEEVTLFTSVATPIAEWLESRPVRSVLLRASPTAVGGVLLAFGGAWLKALGVIAVIVGVGAEALVTWWAERRRAHADGDRTRHEQELVQLAAELNVLMNDALAPIAKRIAELAPLSVVERQHHLKPVAQLVASTATLLRRDVKRLRVTVYAVQPSRGRRSRLMRPLVYQGRSDEPSPFYDATPDGRAAFATLDGGRPEFVADVAAEDVTRWKNGPHGYSTFVTVPIVVDDNGYGLLSADAPAVGDLTGNDVPIITVLAEMLGIAFALCDSKFDSKDRAKPHTPPAPYGPPRPPRA
ncbi:MAG: GAF domain-containing protein [Cellulomonadaceae bacterium]|nr:GAF domain-containing protein [Cellulomonadaceae bacterium]